MAQFGIRDTDSALQDVMEEPRGTGLVSLRNGSVMTSSLRNIESAPQILEQRQIEQQYQKHQYLQDSPPKVDAAAYLAELPTQQFDDMEPESSFNAVESIKSDDTPTNIRDSHFELANSPELVHGNENTVVLSDIPPPHVGPKPSSPLPLSSPLPAVEGREGDIWTLPSQRPAGGLHVQNSSVGDDSEWPQEAIMHMNLSSR